MDDLDKHILRQDVDQMTIRFLMALHGHVNDEFEEKVASGGHSHLDAWDVMTTAVRKTLEDRAVWYFAEEILGSGL